MGKHMCPTASWNQWHADTRNHYLLFIKGNVVCFENRQFIYSGVSYSLWSQRTESRCVSCFHNSYTFWSKFLTWCWGFCNYGNVTMLCNQSMLKKCCEQVVTLFSIISIINLFFCFYHIGKSIPTPSNKPVLSLCDLMQCPPYAKCFVNPFTKAPQCYCDDRCSFETDIICASNMRHYTNECFMQIHSCQINRKLTVLKHGLCIFPNRNKSWAIKLKIGILYVGIQAHYGCECGGKHTTLRFRYPA